MNNLVLLDKSLCSENKCDDNRNNDLKLLELHKKFDRKTYQLNRRQIRKLKIVIVVRNYRHCLMLLLFRFHGVKSLEICEILTVLI